MSSIDQRLPQYYDFGKPFCCICNREVDSIEIIQKFGSCNQFDYIIIARCHGKRETLILDLDKEMTINLEVPKLSLRGKVFEGKTTCQLK